MRGVNSVSLVSFAVQFLPLFLASWRLIPGAIVCAALALPFIAHAQTLPHAEVQQRAQRVDQLFNWYYASVYGTGVYKIGEESVGVVRLPFAFTIEKATDEHWGLRLTLPVSLALAEFDLVNFDFGKVRANGVSIVPGIEGELLLAPNWTLRPFVSVGGGWEFERDSSALIYSTGVSTAYQGRPAGNFLYALGGKLVFAGYRAGSESSTLAALSLGGDLGIPTGVEFSGRQLIFGTQLIGTVYFNDLDILLPASGVKDVSREVELALTLGVRRPFEVLGISFDRVGLGYRKGSDGLRGVRLVGSFPF